MVSWQFSRTVRSRVPLNVSEGGMIACLSGVPSDYPFRSMLSREVSCPKRQILPLVWIFSGSPEPYCPILPIRPILNTPLSNNLPLCGHRVNASLARELWKKYQMGNAVGREVTPDPLILAVGLGGHNSSTTSKTLAGENGLGRKRSTPVTIA